MSGFITTEDGKVYKLLRKETEIEKALETINVNFKDILEENSQLKEKVKEAQTEVYANEEFKRYKERMQPFVNGFPIYNEEKKAIEDFEKVHRRTCGDCFSYVFTPTGIGTFAEVRCEKCGEVFDFRGSDI